MCIQPAHHQPRMHAATMYGCMALQVRRYAPDDLLFVIDDITQGDDTRVGVMWCASIRLPVLNVAVAVAALLILTPYAPACIVITHLPA